MQVQSQGHHTVDRLEERNQERERFDRRSLKGREIIIRSQRNIGTVSKAILENFRREKGGAHMGIFECVDTILNRTENPEPSKIPFFKLLGVVLLWQKIPCLFILFYFLFFLINLPGSFNFIFCSHRTQIFHVHPPAAYMTCVRAMRQSFSESEETILQ